MTTAAALDAVVAWNSAATLEPAPRGAVLEYVLAPAFDEETAALLRGLEVGSGLDEVFPRIPQYYLLFLAFVQLGLSSQVAWILGNDSHSKLCQVTKHESLALRTAVEYQHLDIVTDLLTRTRSKADARKNIAIRRAADMNNLGIVRALIQHGADPASEDSYALRVAVRNGDPELVYELLSGSPDAKRVQPAARKNEALCSAVDRGHLGIVKALIEAGSGVNAGCSQNQPLRHAIGQNHKSIALYLLSLGRDAHIDPRAKDGWAVIKAAETGQREVIEVILKEYEIPTTVLAAARKTAIERGHKRVAALFDSHVA